MSKILRLLSLQIYNIKLTNFGMIKFYGAISESNEYTSNIRDICFEVIIQISFMPSLANPLLFCQNNP